jgi:hypothetical protein
MSKVVFFGPLLVLIGQLHDRGQLDIVYESLGVTGQSNRIVLQISEEAFNLPETQ